MRGASGRPNRGSAFMYRIMYPRHGRPLAPIRLANAATAASALHSGETKGEGPPPLIHILPRPYGTGPILKI